ncbi:MAG TPA: hypothetical protein VFA80_05760 [Xanthobacteraceae bacterium]|nr:hypothetical protein [Xanthobacteraceae bacterium]
MNRLTGEIPTYFNLLLELFQSWQWNFARTSIAAAVGRQWRGGGKEKSRDNRA